MGGKETRLRILETSRRLFNDHGTQAISTNHIAKDMGISPGNLYYHFKNKEEIIRTLLVQMFEEAKDRWYTERSPAINDLLHLVQAGWEALWEYRFFQREQIALLERDAELKQWYQATLVQRQGELTRFFERLVQSGVVLEPDDPTTLPSLVTTCWIVGEYWQSFLYLAGQPVTAQTIREGLRLIYQVVRPHLTEHARRKLSCFENVFHEERLNKGLMAQTQNNSEHDKENTDE